MMPKPEHDHKSHDRADQVLEGHAGPYTHLTCSSVVPACRLDTQIKVPGITVSPNMLQANIPETSEGCMSLHGAPCVRQDLRRLCCFV